MFRAFELESQPPNSTRKSKSENIDLGTASRRRPASLNGQIWDVAAIPKRSVLRQVGCQNPTYSEESTGQELRPQLGRLETVSFSCGNERSRRSRKSGHLIAASTICRSQFELMSVLP